MEKDYFGFEPAYIDGQGYRRKGTRPKAVLKSEFSKSLLDEENGEYYYDEFGVKRRKKKTTELTDIDVSEISYVDFPATKKKFYITKGDGKKMEIEKDDRCEWTTVQNQVFGYTEDDLSMLNDENIEIEKSSEDEKWPSLTRQFNLNQRRLEKAYELATIGERAI